MGPVKRDDRRRELDHDDLARARAATEAATLLSDMNKQLDAVRSFITAQQHELTVRPPTPKRLARIRLMSEDVKSAAMFATKGPEGSSDQKAP